MTFWKSVGVLVGGTALGHGITAATLPILTRIYTPAEYGAYATFTAVVAIFSVAACLRYEIAIALPSENHEARSLLLIALWACLGTGILLLIGALLIRFYGMGYVGSLGREDVLLIPVAIAFAGSLAALQNWMIRHGDFGGIARSRVVQSASAAIVQITLGVVGLSLSGLIYGYTASFLLAGSFLALRLDWQTYVANSVIPGSKSLLGTARKYLRFPQYSAPEALLNSAALQFPIVLVATLGGASEAGFIMLAMSVLQAPMSLIGSAIAQVFLSRAAEASRTGSLKILTLDTIDKLTRTGFGPIIGTAFIASVVFPIVFGASWERSGQLILWMAPWFAVQFLTSPLSMILQITGRQGVALILQSCGFLWRLAVVITASSVGGGLGESFALANAAFYLVYFLVIVFVVKIRAADLLRIAQRNVLIVAAWMVAGLGCNWFISNV